MTRNLIILKIYYLLYLIFSFEGYWINDKKSGKGTYYKSDGEK